MKNMNPYKLENGYEITRRGHKLFPADIVKDLNYWRNKYRKLKADFDALRGKQE